MSVQRSTVHPSKTSASGTDRRGPEQPSGPGRPRVHLIAFAVAVPTAGVAGVLVGVLDAVPTAAVLPVAVLIGVVSARLLVSRILRWARSVITAVTGGRDR